MTSTTTHTSHSSHASHSNSPHGNHSNSVTSTPTYAYNGHTATIGGVDWSSSASSSTKLGVYGSTGSLTQLLNIVNSMRARFTDNSIVVGGGGTASSSSAPGTGNKISSSTVAQLLNRSGGSLSARYQAVTAKVNVTTNGAHTNTSGSSSLLAAGSRISGHSNTPGASYSLDTNGRTGYESPVKAAYSTPNTAPSFTQGSKVTKENFNSIMSALSDNTVKQWSGPAEKTDSSWTLQVTQSYHSSHSSHASHSSHSSCKEEFKQNITDFNKSALDLIDKINLVNFNYTEEAVENGFGDDTTINHIGFLAEKVPEEFSTHYHDRMDYINCIGILLKAVQELNLKIEKLDKKCK